MVWLIAGCDKKIIIINQRKFQIRSKTMLKKIGILTSGGDAPGMNAVINGVVKAAQAQGISVFAIYDGYKGLIENKIEPITVSFAQKTSNHGGTIIGSARYPQFKEVKVREQAVQNLKDYGIEALVVIGGDGSYQGAEGLTKLGINCIGIPGTIDNDIVSTDYTIGFDTALNTVVEMIDRVRDTMESHNRAAVVEIMGNNCGDLTLYSSLATGCEIISTNDNPLTEAEIIKAVNELKQQNHRSVIVAVSEHLYPDLSMLAKNIEAATNYITRAVILGHLQRGGKPSAMDRYWGTKFGAFAVSELIKGNGGLYLGISKNELVAQNIEQTLNMVRPNRQLELEQTRLLNRQI